jgi:hypothetical protein
MQPEYVDSRVLNGQDCVYMPYVASPGEEHERRDREGKRNVRGCEPGRQRRNRQHSNGRSVWGGGQNPWAVQTTGRLWPMFGLTLVFRILGFGVGGVTVIEMLRVCFVSQLLIPNLSHQRLE